MPGKSVQWTDLSAERAEPKRGARDILVPVHTCACNNGGMKDCDRDGCACLSTSAYPRRRGRGVKRNDIGFTLLLGQ